MQERDENPGHWFRCQCKTCGGLDGCTVTFHVIWKFINGDLCEMCSECDDSIGAKNLQKEGSDAGLGQATSTARSVEK